MAAAEQINENAPVVLTVTNNGIKAEFEGSSGNKVFKNIGLNSLARVLNRDAEFDTGFLPIYGSNYIAIKRYIKMGDKEILFLEASPSNRTVNFQGGREFSAVRFPGLIMAVVCRVNANGTLTPQHTKLYATQGPILRETDQLYKFPFANVYQEDSRICWGGVQWQRGITNLTQAGSLLERFLSETMNRDLYQGNQSLESKLESLQNACEYPYQELRPDFTFRELVSLTKSRSMG